MMNNRPICYPRLGRDSPPDGRAGTVAPQNRLIQIFRDHWKPFKRFYPYLVNKDIEANVQKMMNCGSLANGYAEYHCRCGHIKRVPFSCKSRFCLRCAKVYIDKWVAKMKETVFAKVKHRHIILTVPGSLWKYFHKTELLKLLVPPRREAKLVKEVSKICLKGKEIDLGIILVTQTAGRSASWNPHLHLLVTEGGLDKNNHWSRFSGIITLIIRLCVRSGCIFC